MVGTLSNFGKSLSLFLYDIYNINNTYHNIWYHNTYISYLRRHYFYQQWYFESYESSWDCYKQKV